MDLDVMAQQLVLQLESLVDVLDAREIRNADKGASGGRSRASGPLCLDSALDFISPDGDEISVKSNKERYDRQLALCQRCEMQSECLDIAISENRESGIWGGLMPAERRKYVQLLHESV